MVFRALRILRSNWFNWFEASKRLISPITRNEEQGQKELERFQDKTPQKHQRSDNTSCVPIRRLHPPKCVFVGRLRHGGVAKTVPIHDASSEGCIPRPIALPRRDERSRNSKATSNAPSVSPAKWRIHQMDTSQPTLSQNSQRAGEDGTFIQTK